MAPFVDVERVHRTNEVLDVLTALFLVYCFGVMVGTKREQDRRDRVLAKAAAGLRSPFAGDELLDEKPA